VIVDAYVQSVSRVLVPIHSCWVNPAHHYNMQHSLDIAFAYVFWHISLCWLAHLLSHKKELSGRQLPQSQSCWPLSNSPWHTKRRGFLVMECAGVFVTWKPRLVYCMRFTVMESCYSYRESKTRYYWSSWWPIHSVSWVSPDSKTSGVELILFQVFSCLEAAFSQHSSDCISNILS